MVVYQGEFLPILAWEDFPGCQAPPGEPMAMAVLRRRLGLPLEELVGTMDPPAESWLEAEEDDEAGSWLSGLCRVDGLELRRVDPDRLIALLHRFREDR